MNVIAKLPSLTVGLLTSEEKSMKTIILVLFGVLALSMAVAASAGPVPYLGDWSNGRGDTLSIKAKTIQFASDKPVPYRDITRVTNGQEFDLEITSEGKLNYLTKYIHLSMGEGDKPGEMKATLYDSLKDMQDGQNSQGEATWYRDK
jgi:hypothetical protein